jgi:hypothetical protein
MTEDHKPPVFDSWSSWYILVLGAMLLQVALYAWLTRLFS